MDSREGQQRQLTLEVRLRDDATFDNFYLSDANRPLVEAAQAQAQPGGEPVIFMHGGPGSGKSHLLQASCHRLGPGSLYLPLAQLVDDPPDEVLHAVEHLDLVCLDDLHAVSGNGDWERGLFHLFNRARETGCALQFAADTPPRHLPLDLADLRSRLSWAVVFKLAAPSDVEKAEILRFRAARRGLSLAPETASFIVNRASRSLDDLLALLETLDRASLAEQRPLSIPFVKSILRW